MWIRGALTRQWPFLVGAVWLLGILAGGEHLLAYKGRAAPTVEPPPRWPSASAISRGDARPTLLMLVHPKCPCTSASVAELERLMERARGLVAARALVVRPAGAPGDWAHTDLRRRLEGIPGVSVVTDEGGAEAARFHVTTSGHVLLYDRDGRLSFSGGITSARGHEGDSIGKQSLTALIQGSPEITSASPVFGCPLSDPVTRDPPSNEGASAP